jgi:hypothetical protein
VKEKNTLHGHKPASPIGEGEIEVQSWHKINGD